MVFREGFLKAPVIMVLVCLPSDALATPTVLLGFLLPGMWGIFSWLLQQSAAAPPYLGGGVSPHGRPPPPTLKVEELLSALLRPRSSYSLEVG